MKDYAAMAEIFGMLAIVVSLIFVGYEIRENTDETRAASRQSLATRAQDLALFTAQFGGGLRVLYNYEELTGPQQAAAEAWVPALIRNVEEAYLSYRDGRLDEEYWNTRAAVLDAVIGSEIGNFMYSEMKDGNQLAPDFVISMEEYMVAQ